MSQRLIALIALIAAFASGTALVGQQSPSAETPHVLPKHQLPRVFLVQDFFAITYGVLENGGTVKDYYLSLIGIKPGSGAEEALLRAAERARLLQYGEEGPFRIVRQVGNMKEVIEHPDRPDDSPPRLSYEEIHEREIQKAVKLAEIYKDLTADLAAAGSTIDGIESYIDREFRRSGGMASSQPFDDANPIWAISRAFEERLAQ